MKVVAAPKVFVDTENFGDTPGLNCGGCNTMFCVPD